MKVEADEVNRKIDSGLERYRDANRNIEFRGRNKLLIDCKKMTIVSSYVFNEF